MNQIKHTAMLKAFGTVVLFSIVMIQITRAGNVDSLKIILNNSTGTSQIDIQNEIAIELLTEDPVKAEGFAREALKLSSELNYPAGYAKALWNIGQSYYTRNIFNSSIDYFLKSIDIFRQLNDSSSLSSLFQNTADTYRMLNKSDSAKFYCDSALKLVTAKTDSALVLTKKGMLFWRKGQFDSALVDFKWALKLRKAVNDSEMVASSLNNIGSAFWKQGNFHEAMNYFIESMSIREKLDDKEGLTTSLGNIGSIYQKLKYYKKAEDNFLSAQKLSDSLNYKFGKAYSRYNLGILYQELGQYKKAMDYFQASLIISSSIQDRNLMVMTKNYLGLIFEKDGNLIEAEKKYNEALAEAKQYSDRYAEAEILKNLGNVKLKQNKLDDALNYLNKSLTIAEPENLNELIKDDHYLKYQTYDKLNQRTLSLENFKSYSEMSESIFNDKIVNSTANMLIRYEIEKSESELKLLKKEKELNDAELEIQKNFRKYFIAITILAIGIVIILIMLYRYKSKTSKKIEKQKNELQKLNIQLNEQNAKLKEMNDTKDKLFSVIAHDIRNPFTAILGYSEVLYHEGDDLEREEIKEFAGYLNEASSSLLGLIHNLLDWARSQMNSIKVNYSNINLGNLLRTVIKVHEGFAEIKQINLKSSIPDDCWVYADFNMIDTILRNLISNAIKFTLPKGEVTIEVEKLYGKYKISVKDSGVGMSKEVISQIMNSKIPSSTKGTRNESGTGLGLLLCKEFIEKNNSKLMIESEISCGSKFWFELPVSKNVAVKEENHHIKN